MTCWLVGSGVPKKRGCASWTFFAGASCPSVHFLLGKSGRLCKNCSRQNQAHANASQQYVASSSERDAMSDGESGQLSVYQAGNCGFL